MRVKWENVSLVLGSCVLLALGRIILAAVSFEELARFVFPAGIDFSRVKLLCTLGVLMTGALKALAILKGKG